MESLVAYRFPMIKQMVASVSSMEDDIGDSSPQAIVVPVEPDALPPIEGVFILIIAEAFPVAVAVLAVLAVLVLISCA